MEGYELSEWNIVSFYSGRFWVVRVEGCELSEWNVVRLIAEGLVGYQIGSLW